LKGGQYAICVALVVGGDVKVAVLGCPNLPIRLEDDKSPKGVLAFGIAGEKAYYIPLNDYRTEKPILSKMKVVPEISQAMFFSSSYDQHKQIVQHLGIARTPYDRVHSQAKYVMLARGDASLYIRLPRGPTGEEIWV
jgi:3'(2'), 5'-bisphosphate nucleotidase